MDDVRDFSEAGTPHTLTPYSTATRQYRLQQVAFQVH